MVFVLFVLYSRFSSSLFILNAFEGKRCLTLFLYNEITINPFLKSLFCHSHSSSFASFLLFFFLCCCRRRCNGCIWFKSFLFCRSFQHVLLLISFFCLESLFLLSVFWLCFENIFCYASTNVTSFIYYWFFFRKYYSLRFELLSTGNFNRKCIRSVRWNFVVASICFVKSYNFFVSKQFSIVHFFSFFFLLLINFMNAYSWFCTALRCTDYFFSPSELKSLSLFQS